VKKNVKERVLFDVEYDDYDAVDSIEGRRLDQHGDDTLEDTRVFITASRHGAAQQTSHNYERENEVERDAVVGRESSGHFYESDEPQSPVGQADTCDDAFKAEYSGLRDGYSDDDA